MNLDQFLPLLAAPEVKSWGLPVGISNNEMNKWKFSKLNIKSARGKDNTQHRDFQGARSATTVTTCFSPFSSGYEKSNQAIRKGVRQINKGKNNNNNVKLPQTSTLTPTSTSAPLQRPPFSDVTVVIGSGQGMRYALHRLVLCACSDFFNAALTGPWRCAQSEVLDLRHIKPLTPTGFEVVVTHMYTGRLPTDRCSLVLALKVAAYLQMNDLVSDIVNQVKPTCTRANVFDILSLGLECCAFDLVSYASGFITYYWDELVAMSGTTRKLAKISGTQLRQILCVDTLYARDEFHFYRVLAKRARLRRRMLVCLASEQDRRMKGVRMNGVRGLSSGPQASCSILTTDEEINTPSNRSNQGCDPVDCVLGEANNQNPDVLTPNSERDSWRNRVCDVGGCGCGCSLSSDTGCTLESSSCGSGRTMGMSLGNGMSNGGEEIGCFDEMNQTGRSAGDGHSGRHEDVATALDFLDGSKFIQQANRVDTNTNTNEEEGEEEEGDGDGNDDGVGRTKAQRNGNSRSNRCVSSPPFLLMEEPMDMLDVEDEETQERSLFDLVVLESLTLEELKFVKNDGMIEGVRILDRLFSALNNGRDSDEMFCGGEFAEGEDEMFFGRGLGGGGGGSSSSGGGGVGLGAGVSAVRMSNIGVVESGGVGGINSRWRRGRGDGGQGNSDSNNNNNNNNGRANPQASEFMAADLPQTPSCATPEVSPFFSVYPKAVITESPSTQNGTLKLPLVALDSSFSPISSLMKQRLSNISPNYRKKLLDKLWLDNDAQFQQMAAVSLQIPQKRFSCSTSIYWDIPAVLTKQDRRDPSYGDDSQPRYIRSDFMQDSRGRVFTCVVYPFGAKDDNVMSAYIYSHPSRVPRNSRYYNLVNDNNYSWLSKFRIVAMVAGSECEGYAIESIQHVFCNETNNWGWSEYLTLAKAGDLKLIDPATNKIRLRVSIVSCDVSDGK